ncbi:MAG: NAD(P)-dependent dehydrogenase (short-subunit alcohol dehydrogenase family), partial [Planctomycetota bacterium]
MSGKIALITGASRGFGAAVAENLAANGYHVIALARTVGGLEELDDRIQSAGGSATLVPLDICDDEGLKRLCLSIHKRWGKLDLWVHSAIFAGPQSPVGHVPLSDWEKTLAINIRATQRLVEMVEPLLKNGGGTAVLPTDEMA